MAVTRWLDGGWQVEHGCGHGDFQRVWGEYSTLNAIIARRMGVRKMGTGGSLHRRLPDHGGPGNRPRRRATFARARREHPMLLSEPQGGPGDECIGNHCNGYLCYGIHSIGYQSMARRRAGQSAKGAVFTTIRVTRPITRR